MARQSAPQLLQDTEAAADHTQADVLLPLLVTEAGDRLEDVVIRYETWGRLNAARDNAIVVCHALTGDAHAGDGLGTSGWWSGLIGPGKCLDTRRFFVVCSNVVGGCAGSTGPASPSPQDQRPYALRFPVVTIRDMVRAQVEWIKALGIQRVHTVIGGSMGGMQAWEWVFMAPELVERAVIIAAHAAFPPLCIGYNEAMRQAIVNDPDWQQGDYHGTGRAPHKGLAVARAIGMLTYRSHALFASRFGRRLTEELRCVPFPGAGGGLQSLTTPLFEVESYLRRHGDKLNARFDANSYLYLTRAMDSHDIGRGRGGVAEALCTARARLLVIGIDSDYLYGADDLRQDAELARRSGVSADFAEIRSIYGHDAFLTEPDKVDRIVRDWLERYG